MLIFLDEYEGSSERTAEGETFIITGIREMLVNSSMIVKIYKSKRKDEKGEVIPGSSVYFSENGYAHFVSNSLAQIESLEETSHQVVMA